MAKVRVFQPSDIRDSEPPLEQFGFRLLAEGDSWFSIGTLNPLRNSNLLFEMDFRRSACAVNCAQPGDTLRRVAQMTTDPRFIDLLCGRRARLWDGIVVSCGGNDLIEAAMSPPVDPEGTPVPRALRLLLTEDEWGPPALGASRYVSDAGWQTFTDYVQANLQRLLDLRERGPSAGQPVFVHGYAVPTPRRSGMDVGGPWLLPALQRYGIPAVDATGVARDLVLRLAALLAACAADFVRFPGLRFFDSTSIALDEALPDAEGSSGDWINEIHLTRRGYGKLAVPWAAQIEAALSGEPVMAPVVDVPIDEPA